MKKIISLLLLAVATFIYEPARAQLATQSLQTVGNATLTVLKQKQDTANQYLRILTTGGNTAGTATLAIIKQKLDTANQYTRVITTAQTSGNASLTLLKKTNDTLAQYQRVQITGQTASTASLALIKKEADTLNQYTRVLTTGQTASTASLALIKKEADTLNQYARSTKSVLDSINQVDKITTYSFAAASTNTGTTYQAGDVIMDDGRSIQCYSTTIGSGRWEITSAIMWLSQPNAGPEDIDINISVFSNTIAAGADGAVFNPNSTSATLYLGTFNMGVSFQTFTTSPIYNSREKTGGTPGDKTILVPVAPTGAKLYFVLWTASTFVPVSTQTYNVRLIMRKLK